MYRAPPNIETWLRVWY